MSYTNDEIKKYLKILNDNKPKKILKIQTCSGPFTEYLGQYLCTKCGKFKGHILGKLENNDYSRLHYQKKSVYHRKYYFEKKVNIISKLISLNSEEKNRLYENLLVLDSNCIKMVNKKFSRKRMININYVILKVLEEMNCEKYKNLKIKISDKILEIYDEWWKLYKETIL